MPPGVHLSLHPPQIMLASPLSEREYYPYWCSFYHLYSLSYFKATSSFIRTAYCVKIVTFWYVLTFFMQIANHCNNRGWG